MTRGTRGRPSVHGKSRNRLNFYELSPTQAGMVFHRLSRPDFGVDVQQVIITLDKSIDPDAIAAVWRQMVDRHPVMRTSFHWEGTPQPMQQVWDHAELPVEFLDWRDLAPGEHKACLSAFLSTDRKNGFDLSVAPVMRLTFIRAAGEPLVLVWTFHHSLLDGRSIAFILREAFTLYRARVCHDTNSLPLPKRSFRQHIEWLRNLDLLRAKSYWRNALKGFRAPPRLWLERSEKSQQSADPAFGACEIELEPEETNALNIAASVAGVTMNTILQGAWAMLLSRLSGESDVVFGATEPAGDPV